MKISGVFFAIVILAFLLPFMVVKCGDTKIVSVTGMKLATGGNLSLDYMNKLGESTKALSGLADAMPGTEDAAEVEEEVEKEDNSKKLKPNVWALIALLMAIGGLISSLLLPKKLYLLPLAMAVVGVITLFMIKMGLKAGMDLSSDGGSQFADMIKVQAQFGYYLAFLGFLIAGATAFLSGRSTPYVSYQPVPNIMPDRVETALNKASDSIATAGTAVMDKVDGVVEKSKDIMDHADLEESFGRQTDEKPTVLDEVEEEIIS